MIEDFCHPACINNPLVGFIPISAVGGWFRKSELDFSASSEESVVGDVIVMASRRLKSSRREVR